MRQPSINYHRAAAATLWNRNTRFAVTLVGKKFTFARKKNQFFVVTNIFVTITRQRICFLWCKTISTTVIPNLT
jgi:hypothetical protein